MEAREVTRVWREEGRLCWVGSKFQGIMLNGELMANDYTQKLEIQNSNINSSDI